MLFLTRAAVCIGLVAVAASGTGGGSATTLDRDAREVATRLGQACLASQDCWRIGTEVVAGALPLVRTREGEPRGGPVPRQASASPQRVRTPAAGRAKAPRPHRSAPTAL